MADTNLIEEILKRTDIVDIISRYINVTKKGRSHVALCPFHDDKNPSLMISRDKQIFKCFVCGAGGNTFSFVERIEKIPFMEAVKKVASYIGYDDPRLNKTSAYTKVDDEKEMMYRAHQELTSFYRYNLTTKQGAKAKEYFESRHLSRDLQNKYSLGYAPEDGFKTIEYLVSKGFSYKTLEEAGIATHVQDGYLDRNHGRIIYPIFDEQNRPIAYSARRLNDDEDVPKYVNSVDSDIFHKSEILYNYSHALEASLREGKVYVVEGFNDVYALARVGLDGAVALMGTALTNKHIALLRALKSEIILCLDPDDAGKKAMIKASDMLDKAHLDYSMKLFPRGENRDLDDYLNDEGEESFKTYLGMTGDKFSFLLSVYEGGERLKSARDKQKFINAFIPKLLSLDESLEKDDIIIKLARITGFEVEAIRRAVENAKNKIDENDMTYAGDFFSEIPELYGGININLGWKGFDFAISGYGMTRRQINTYSAQTRAFSNGRFNVSSLAEGRWAYWPEQGIDTRETATFPRLTLGSNTHNTAASTFWIKDGSFFRINNMALGYTIPEKWSSKIHIDKLRIYFSVVNPFVFDGVYGDAEFTTSYPLMRTYKIGLDLNF